jgi:hypothetical protein
LGVARIALGGDVKLSAATTHGIYKVALTQHLAAAHDEETLLASVLMHSYAFAETAATERLCCDARDFGGVEDWGTRLLTTTGLTWDCLSEGVAGAVESRSSETPMRTAAGAATSSRQTASGPSARHS